VPIYEYRCEDGHQYERSESFEAPTEQACPRCGRPSRRLLSLPALIFKGPGFYSTDNRKGTDGSKDGQKQKDAAAKAVPGKEPSSEKKPSSDKKPESST
jgi:putative FmdB family regulatory protein